MADFLGETWSCQIKLQVLAIDAELLEAWPTIDDDPTTPFAILPEQPALNLARSEEFEDWLAEPSLPSTARALTNDDHQSEPGLMISEPLPEIESSVPLEIDTPPESDVIENMPVETLSSMPPWEAQSEPGLSTDSEEEPSDIDRSTRDLSWIPMDSTNETDFKQYLDQVAEQVIDAIVSDVGLENPPLNLVLAQETFVSQSGQSLTLAGRVEVEAETIPGLYSPPQPLHAELGIYLREPENTETLLEVHQPLAEDLPPVPFVCTLELPQTCQGHLILGEVILYATAAGNKQPTVLATQTFSIAANLEEVFQAIQHHRHSHPPSNASTPDRPSSQTVPELSEDSSTELPVLQPLSPTDDCRVNLALFELVKDPQQVRPLQLRPLQGWSLPPQIHYRDSQRVPANTPQLPILPRPPVYPTQSSEPIDTGLLASFAPDDTSQLSPTPSFSDITEGIEMPNLSFAEPQSSPSASLLAMMSVLDHLSASPSAVAIADDHLPVAHDTVQSLKPQQRLWSQLMALASVPTSQTTLEAGVISQSNSTVEQKIPESSCDAPIELPLDLQELFAIEEPSFVPVHSPELTATRMIGTALPPPSMLPLEIEPLEPELWGDTKPEPQIDLNNEFDEFAKQ
jgi:hypothetical protein